MVLILKMNEEKVKLAFEFSLIQMVTSSATLRAIDMALISEGVVMAPAASLAASQTRKEESEGFRQFIVTAPQ